MSHQQQQFLHYHHHQVHQQVQSEMQMDRRSSDLDGKKSGDPQNRNRNTERGAGGVSMDLRNLCQRIDVDSLRAKLPSLPQLKLPKSLPKLRGRKIFRSSKSGVASGENGPGAGAVAGGSSKDGGQPQQMLQVAAQSQQFINRTPQRISTISSLMYEADHEEVRHSQQPGGTYRSAGSLDDDYYAPSTGDRASRPISPIKIPTAGGAEASPSGTGHATLTQRLQRGYKSLSELRLKHIFAKQTTVRRDNIEVDRYVEQYERELKSEKRAQARRDREIAENYDIKVQTLATTRQNTFEDDEVEREQFEKSKISHETDESGMEATPPLPTRRKPGIAATRFAKVRKPPLEMEEQSVGKDEENQQETPPPPPPPRPSSYKQQLLNKLPNLPSLPNLSQLSKTKEERSNNQENTSASKSGLRQNIKRLRKSIKRPAKIKPKAKADSDEEEETAETDRDKDKSSDPPAKSSSANLRARISRFASTEQLQQRWRKSFKSSSSKVNREATEKVDNTDSTPGATATTGVLGGLLLGSQLEKTLAKLNEKMHQLKFFQRYSNRNQEPMQPKPNTVGHEPVEIDDDEELAATYHHSDSDEDEDEDADGDSGEDISAEEAFGKIQEEEDRYQNSQDNSRRGSSSLSGTAPAHAARQMAKLAEIQAASKSGAAAWSSESLEEIADEDYPRVLIHQEHSDAFESTLIIAVASKGSVSVSPGVRNTGSQTYPVVKYSSSGFEQTATGGAPSRSPGVKDSPSPEFKTPAAQTPDASAWLPNEQIIAGFKDQTNASWPAPALYKPKSIDIFEAASGGSAAFADFDEALRNAPVLRISAGSSCDTSGEEADDSTSRVTKIRVQSPQIGNSRESLMAQEEEDEEDAEADADVDMELEMEGVLDLDLDLERDSSERPPSASPPPPPLPQRRPPPPKIPATPPIYDAVPPPLPVSKPPIPDKAPTTAPGIKSPPPTVTKEIPPVSKENPLLGRGIPQRSASMSRPAKPLVKTSSLRLTYNEQVRPGDVGKVNKLISRFEGGRPRLCPRRMHSEEYERGREDDEAEEEDAEPLLELKNFQKRAVESVTPTNRGVIIPQITVNNNNNNSNEKSTEEEGTEEDDITKSRKKKRESLELSLDRQNSNCSRSEYGSPLSFPSSRRSSTPTNLSSNPNPHPILNPNANPIQNPVQILQQQRRSRRSMTRDDDNFYSFDSDEENSYYSISPSGSSRYVVEI
ncbi:LOW QUALITY PROTEIN: histone acetyltransferase KAT6A [Drosophila serrata]|uniref:LOW QUALITY PROTEIN: histone acetyltransferase KAT6A n=1 Tax=Drosophila serrata TaxID=7274 RepID=UPI000A1D07E5|nr:LOW QUALITY PROTEIN: histone acetyltransferase KAT6A [Drosophila serrata]